MGESIAVMLARGPLEETRSLPDFDLGGRPEPMVSPPGVSGGLDIVGPFGVAAPADPLAPVVAFDNPAEAEFCVAAICTGQRADAEGQVRR